MKARRLMGTLVLVMALVFGIVGTAAPQAAARTETKKLTMIVGEKYGYKAIIGRFTSASTSKKSVVKVKKTSAAVTFTAKKAGKATVTARMTGGTVYRFVITVKKLKIQAKYSIGVTQGYSNITSNIVFEFTNKTGVFLPSATFNVSLINAAGEVVKTEKILASDLVQGTKVYRWTSYYGADAIVNVKVAKKVDVSSHNPTAKYLNMTKKVNVSVSDNGSSYSVRFKNKTKKSVSAYACFVFYDENGNVMTTYQASAYLTSKGVYTYTLTKPTGAASYKMYKRACARG
ncbi:MAG: hypothetical protein VZQ83_02860 [Eubacterium sp.]|nr:hypothetical protein [Eubacterium sp.]